MAVIVVVGVVVGVIWKFRLNKDDHSTGAANVSESHSPSGGASDSTDSDHDRLSGTEVSEEQYRTGAEVVLANILPHESMSKHITHIASCGPAETFSAVTTESKALVASGKDIPPTSKDFDVVLDSVTRCAGQVINAENLLTRENYDVAVQGFLKEATLEIPDEAFEKIAPCICDRTWDHICDKTKMDLILSIGIDEDNPDFPLIGSATRQCSRGSRIVS